MFMQITRDGLTLYLFRHSGDGEVGGLMHLYVPDVDARYAGIAAKGVHVPDLPEDQPWGSRDFRVADPASYPSQPRISDIVTTDSPVETRMAAALSAWPTL